MDDLTCECSVESVVSVVEGSLVSEELELVADLAPDSDASEVSLTGGNSEEHDGPDIELVWLSVDPGNSDILCSIS